MPKIKIRPSDTAFSQWIRLRDMECVRCHSQVELNGKGLPVSHQASHFKGRGKESTRFEPLNVDTLCWGCHAYLGSQPDEHYQFQIKLKGQEVVDAIVLQSNQYKKRNDKEEAAYWRSKVKEVIGGQNAK